jgi:hypothetical protein
MDSSEQIARLLNEWRGGDVKIWDYNCTLSRLTIRISLDTKEDLFLVCGQSFYICGPFHWENSSLSISIPENSEGQEVKVIQDIRSGFEVHCRLLTLVRNREPSFISEKDVGDSI